MIFFKKNLPVKFGPFQIIIILLKIDDIKPELSSILTDHKKMLLGINFKVNTRRSIF